MLNLLRDIGWTANVVARWALKCLVVWSLILSLILFLGESWSAALLHTVLILWVTEWLLRWIDGKWAGTPTPYEFFNDAGDTAQWIISLYAITIILCLAFGALELVRPLP